jgi:ribose transport system substrate-binding protein
MKKALVFLFIIICICSMNACVSPENGSMHKVMLILRSWSSAAAEDMTRGANAAARECGLALTTKAVMGEDERRQQADLIHAAIEKKFDAIIIEPADAAIVGEAVREAREKGITVVSINSRDEVGQNCTVDIDEKQMADGMVSEIKSLAGGDAGVLILNCLDGYDNTQRMTDVLSARMEELPDIGWDSIDFKTGEYAKIESSLKYSIPENKEKFVVVAQNDYAETVAVNLFRSVPDGQNIGLISFAQDADTISLLEQGWVDAICMNRNIDIGYRAVRQANEGIEGGNPPDVFIPSVFVTAENLYDSDTQELLFSLN